MCRAPVRFGMLATSRIHRSASFFRGFYAGHIPLEAAHLSLLSIGRYDVYVPYVCTEFEEPSYRWRTNQDDNSKRCKFGTETDKNTSTENATRKFPSLFREGLKRPKEEGWPRKSDLDSFDPPSEVVPIQIVRIEAICIHGDPHSLPNAGAHLPPEAEATQERRNCLGCQGGLVYFFSFAPPAVARVSAVSAEHGEGSTASAYTRSERLFCRSLRRGAARKTL